MDNGGIATINSRDRVLYGQLQHAGANQTAPFHLVSVNIDTGAVSNSAELERRARRERGRWWWRNKGTAAGPEVRRSTKGEREEFKAR